MNFRPKNGSAAGRVCGCEPDVDAGVGDFRFPAEIAPVDCQVEKTKVSARYRLEEDLCIG